MSLIRKRKKKKTRFLKIVVFIVIVWSVTGLYTSYKATRTIENGKKPAKEIKILNIIRFFPSYTAELNNLGNIFEGGKSSGRKGWLFNSTYKKVLNIVLRNQDFDKFNLIINHLEEEGKIDSLPYYKGLYLFNKGEFKKAEKYLQTKKCFETIYKTKKIPVIEGILWYNMNKKTFETKYRGMKFLESTFRPDRNFLITYSSTIKPKVQDLAETTLGNREGFFAIARQGEILAIVSNNVNPFTEYYEPGSVIKLITMTAYLSENRNDVTFPFMCTKPLNIDGKAFYDWKKHGEIPAMEDALACSCNLVFGECALSLGKNALLRWYSKFYIDGSKRVNICENNFNIGKLKGEITDRYSLAKAGIGLEHVIVTPYWLIKTASTFARNGRDSFPNCIRAIKVLGVNLSDKAIFNMVFKNSNDYVFDLKKTKPVLKGMEKACEFDTGTGKRARVEGIKILLKTGTAGNKPYNSFIIGFAEYKNGNYSFAIFLKHGGKAEYQAAKTIHNFFKAFKNIM